MTVAYEPMMKACKGNMQTTVYESPFKCRPTTSQKMTLTNRNKLFRRATRSNVVTSRAVKESNSESDNSEDSSESSEEKLNDDMMI